MSLGDKSTPTLDALVQEAHERLGIKPKKPKRTDPEHQIQAALIDAVRNGPLGVKYPDLLDLYANANWAGIKGPREGARRKAEGVTAGVPDLFLPCPSGYYGLYLETKTPEGRVRPEQRAFMGRAVRRGYACAVFRSVEEGLDLLVRYMEGKWIQEPEMLR